MIDEDDNSEFPERSQNHSEMILNQPVVLQFSFVGPWPLLDSVGFVNRKQFLKNFGQAWIALVSFGGHFAQLWTS